MGDHHSTAPRRATQVGGSADSADATLPMHDGDESEFRISFKVLLAACIAAVVITAIIAVGSFSLSFASLWDLAERAGYPHRLAMVWPVVVDLAIVLATVAVIVLGPAGMGNRNQRLYFWAVLTFGGVVSVGGNWLHGYLPHGQPLPGWLAGIISAVAPVSLLAVAHGANILLRVLLQVVARLQAQKQRTQPPASAHREPRTTPAPNAGRQNHVSPTESKPAEDSGADVRAADTVAVPRRNGFHRSEQAGLAVLEEEPITADAGWTEVAQTLVREGVTQKPVDTTAKILELWDRKEPPTKIAEMTRVHRDTVYKITGEAARLLAGADVRPRA